jgi:hypothetical protein
LASVTGIREKRVVMGAEVMRYSLRWGPAARRGDGEDADPARTRSA